MVFFFFFKNTIHAEFACDSSFPKQNEFGPKISSLFVVPIAQKFFDIKNSQQKKSYSRVYIVNLCP